MRRLGIFLLLDLCLITVALSQDKPADPGSDLAAISQRGRALYAYDQAAWHGTDAIFALKPDTKGLAHYLCIKTPSGWLVAFPKWNDAHDGLFIVYEAREKAGKFAARKLDKPFEADSDLVARERAIELAIADFPKPGRPYNTAVLPAPGGNFYVYLYPGQTRENVWPIGGDMRYTISSDGKNVIEKLKLHNAILDMETKENQVGGYHVDVLTAVPVDTDVFFVLNRKPSIPEYVGTPKQMFVIDKEGNIESGKQ